MSAAQDVILHNCTNSRELSQYIWGLYTILNFIKSTKIEPAKVRLSSIRVVRDGFAYAK